MCGIVGYVGKKNALNIIIDGLKRLEYRGYDSAGIALVRNGGIDIRKKVRRDQEPGRNAGTGRGKGNLL